MPTNRTLRSVAAAVLSLLLTVGLLAACPAEDHDLNAARFDTAAAPAPSMAPGPAPMNPHDERALAQRASRSRVEAAEAAAAAERQRILAEAAARAEQQRRIAEQKLRAERPLPPAVMDAAFWRRLANCESPDGRSGRYLGFFQFSRDTARKVGWFDGASYEQQQAMAERWLAMIGGPSRGGTRSGWPHCWWVALRG